MSYRNHNEAITRVAMPERKTPILIPWKEASNCSGHFFAAAWPENEESGTEWGFVKVVDVRYLAQYLNSRKVFEKTYGPVQEVDAKRIRFVLDLADSIRRRKPRLAANAINRAFGETPTWVHLRVWNNPQYWLTGLFNSGLTKCRPLVWYSTVVDRIAQGTFAEDSATALLLLALASIGDLGAFGICKRCTNLFFRIKPSKRYCSERCRSADAMARFRRTQSRGKRKRRLA